MIWSVRPQHGPSVPQKKRIYRIDHHGEVSIIKAWWGDIGMESEVGKCGKTRWPQVCRVQTIGIAFTPLTRIFMFMKSGLQHEISAGRFLSLWGLSPVPPPISALTSIEQFFPNSLLGFEQMLKNWNSDALNVYFLSNFVHFTVPLFSRFYSEFWLKIWFF